MRRLAGTLLLCSVCLAAGVHAQAATARRSVDVVDAELDAARKGTDSAALAKVAVEAGRIRWLRYETVVDRLFPCEGLRGSLAGVGIDLDALGITGDRSTSETVDLELPLEGSMFRLQSLMEGCLRTGRQLFEGADYERAELLFREALTATPRDERAFRHLAMLLAERRRWGELEGVARAHMARNSANAWGTLALGLALYRGGNIDAGSAMLDTGVARLDQRERTRRFQITRLLKPADSAAYTLATAAERGSMEQSFWAMADPLWSRPGNDTRAEFLARVTYADLRWTVEDINVRGSDTPRGRVHIRYGPPNEVMAFRGCDFHPACNPVTDGGRTTLSPTEPGYTEIVTFWRYRNGLMFVFWGQPMTGTAHFPLLDVEIVDMVLDGRPATFDNLDGERIIALPMRLARFRGPGDSVDVALHALPPVSELRAASIVDGWVRADGWLFPRDYPTGIRDSMRITSATPLTRTYRLAPSHYLYRFEVTADGSSAAARSSGWMMAGRDTVTGFDTRGFGLSDVVLASALERSGATTGRWRDVNVTPLLTALPVGGELHLMWEIYDLPARNGEAAYSVTVTVERQRSLAGRIVATVVGALESAARINRSDDRVTIEFDRRVPHANVVLEEVSLRLAGTPAGTYRLTVQVRDAVTGQRVSSTSSFAIAR